MRRPLLAALPLVLAALAALAALAGAAACTGRQAQAARAAAEPAAESGEGYSLYDLPSTWRDQRGAAVRLPSLAGTVRVVAMVYTSCHATCPLIVGELKRIEASLPADRRGDVGFVLVSLDPARDTPGRLAEWAARTELDPARWTLLAGDGGAVREVAAALGVRYQPQAGGEGGAELAHTNVITVLDAAGAVAHQQVGLGEAAGTAAAVRRLLR
jgi:protein SCO1